MHTLFLSFKERLWAGVGMERKPGENTV